MSQTVDYGIDLGTTTSLIAKFTAKGVQIAPSATRSVVTPSAVALNSQNQVLVGQGAFRDPEWLPVSAFKRHMGTSVRLPVGVNGQTWSPEELSAEVLKELKAAARRRFDDDIVDVVITVPAMFQQPQCEATRRAAELAGLRAVALIQEPIAAAGAYLAGRSQPVEGHYLVYDLGGGTFDVSVLRLHDGEFSVRAHGGDNYLGGHDIDRLLKEWILGELARQGRLKEGLTPRQDWFLTQEVEQAKIRLTDERETYLDLNELKPGLPKFDLRRERLESLVTPLLEKTIRFCEDRLRLLELAPEDIQEVFLVGGPTQMPLIRNRLREHFRCEIQFDVDPITAVVEGAALYAGGLLTTVERPSKASTEAVSIEFHFDPMCNDSETSVAGKVLEEGFQGAVMLSTSQGDWETGWLPLQQGAFLTEVSLKPGTLNVFRVSLRDRSGTPREASPAEIAIKQGLASANPVAPYNYGVVLSSGRSAWMIAENTPLPAYRTQSYRSAVSLAPGSSENLNIYLIEGHSTVAEDNIKVGELIISGSDLQYPLGVGDDVEIRLRMDQSRILKAWAYLPLHDAEFAINFHSSIDVVEANELERSSQGLLSLLERADPGGDGRQVEHLREEARELNLEISRLSSAPGRPGEVERLSKKLSDLRAEVRPLSAQTALDELLSETLKKLEMAAGASEAFGDGLTASSCQRLKGEAERLYQQGNAEALSHILDQADGIFIEHYRKTPAFWEGFLEFLGDLAHLAADKARYIAKLAEGRRALEEGNLSLTRLACIEAYRSLPREARESSGTFAQPGLSA